MVYVEINANELKALDAVFVNAKVSIDEGAVLYNLKIKILAAWKKEQDAQKTQIIIEEVKPNAK